MTNNVIRGNKKYAPSRYSPYTQGRPNSKEQEKEVVRLGVEFSLLVAEGMFLLSDNIRSMTLYCFWLLKYARSKNVIASVVVRVILVIQHVFETHIKPKNRVYVDDGDVSVSVHSDLMGTFTESFTYGIRSLSPIVHILKTGRGLVKPSALENYKQELKKLAEKFGKVSEENGFEREAIESSIVHLWESLFQTTGQVLRTNKTINDEMFRPLLDELDRRDCSRSLASLHI